MPFLLVKKRPKELCKKLVKLIDSLEERIAEDEESQIALQKTNEKVLEILATMKMMIYGDEENDPKMADVKRFRDELTDPNTKLFIFLLKKFHLLGITQQNELTKIANFYLHRARQNNFVEYIMENQVVVDILTEGISNDVSSTYYSSMTGECIKHKDLAELFLSPERLHRFFDYAGNVKTDLAMEGFKNLRLLLTVHKKIISSFLKQNFDLIFKHNFSNLLKSENYFTVTKTLILLYDILISYENKQVLAKYMNELPLLIQIMELLRSKQLNLQNSAYNIFKLFLGNDKKSEEIERVLYNNKTVLEDFLKRFENDEDVNLENDKKLLLERLLMLKPETNNGNIEKKQEHSENDDNN